MSGLQQLPRAHIHLSLVASTTKITLEPLDSPAPVDIELLPTCTHTEWPLFRSNFGQLPYHC